MQVQTCTPACRLQPCMSNMLESYASPANMACMRSLSRFISVVLITLVARIAVAKDVNLLAMGDWGTNGPAQKQVASALSDYVTHSGHPFDGMLLAGANFY